MDSNYYRHIFIIHGFILLNRTHHSHTFQFQIFLNGYKDKHKKYWTVSEFIYQKHRGYNYRRSNDLIDNKNSCKSNNGYSLVNYDKVLNNDCVIVN